MSRKAVPYTPATAKLSEMSIALVSTSGVMLEGQEPYKDNDDTFRLIPPDADLTKIRFQHPHYDTAAANRDANVVFPLGLLRELAEQGVIRQVSNKHVGCKGFSTDLKTQYEKLAPAIANEIERSQADAVLLTGGCPACHRVMVVIQREIEARGIPTVSITVSLNETKLMRPPRSVHPTGHRLGHVLGNAGDHATQMHVLKRALHQLEVHHLPGEIVEFEP